MPHRGHVVVPVPRLRVDRLADGAQQPQALAARFLDVLVALGNERADGRRRGVELGHAVFVDDLPVARGIRIGGRALKEDLRGPVGHRPVDDVAVASDPPHVGGAPVDVVLGVEVEDVLVRHRGPHQVAGGRMEDPLRLARRAGGVENEERVLGVHLGRRAFVVHALQLLVKPVVSARRPADVAAGVLHDEHMIHAAGALGGRIGVVLERDGLTGAAPFVGSDEIV
jgi:hypothetical protein